MDDTLPDDVWKDSFDKLLDHRPQLRELNIIKKDVRISFNMDSSVENSKSDNHLECRSENPHLLSVGKAKGAARILGRGNSISTPCEKPLSTNLFQCALSPINTLKYTGLQANLEKKLREIAKEEPRIKKNVCFEVISIDNTASNVADSSSKGSLIIVNETPKRSRVSLVLQPGKWRKTLNNWRRTFQQENPSSVTPKKSLPSNGRATGSTTRISGRKNVNPSIGRATGSTTRISARKSVYINDNIGTCIVISPEDQILKYCGQRQACRFNQTYAPAKMANTSKIGEGVYGEVFKYTTKTNLQTVVVIKILPIEGDMLVNGEVQKTYEQILPEIIITNQMSNLRNNRTNSTMGFVKMHNVCLVKGTYPAHLIKLWEDYDSRKESENDHPEMFTDNQLFIILELNFAGKDMSSFIFQNAEQSYYALQQVVLTLAVGEAAFQFEHRDLHWGNILIEETDKRQVDYRLGGRTLSVATKGIRATLIDYTLSRITVDDCCHYNDLSTDEELFVATGDYQYDIYRMMRDELKNDWASYAPKTNVFWLSYVVSKFIDGVTYKSTNTKTHRNYMKKLEEFKDEVLKFNSAVDCVQHEYRIA